jgi:phosphoglycerate dehydrogenase-like enzyme
MSDRPRLLVDSGSARLVEQVKSLPEAARFEILSYVGEGEEAIAGLMPQAEFVLIYQHRLSGDMIRSAPQLRFIQKFGENCKNIDVSTANQLGIPIATMPLLRNVTVAEHAFGLMIACARKFVAGHLSVTNAVYREMGIEPIRTTQGEIKSNWSKIEGVSELMDASVGIIGLGGIGMEVAKRCLVFGMNVFYFQRERHSPDVEEQFEVHFLPFEELIETVDYLVLVLPHTTETEGMIGPAEFARMKPTATLINVARGAIVDEDALATALRTGEIAMAGLDVYREEPLPESSPLLELPNIVFTPHTAGGSYRSHAVDRPAAIANILRFLRGEPVRGLVKPI